MALNLPTLAELERERAGKPLTKPSRLPEQIRKHERKQSRRNAKAEADRVEAAISSELRAQAFRRDRGRCRVLGAVLVLHTDNPLKLAHAHHVIFRSLGGPDELWNLATISPLAHDFIHKPKSQRITVEGNADETLTCRLIEMETGKVLQEWLSTAGERVVGAPKVKL